MPFGRSVELLGGRVFIAANYYEQERGSAHSSDIFKVSIGTHKRSAQVDMIALKRVADQFVIFHSCLPRTVKDHVMPDGAFNNAWPGHEVSLCKEHSYRDQSSKIPGAWAFDEDTQLFTIIVVDGWHIGTTIIISSHARRTRLQCTLRQPEHGDVVGDLLELFELVFGTSALFDFGWCHPPPGINRVVHEASEHTADLSWPDVRGNMHEMFYQCRLRGSSDTRYIGLRSWTRPAAELLDMAQNLDRQTVPRGEVEFYTTTEGSNVATATISDESITLPSESASTRCVSPKRATGRSHREGAHRSQRRPCRELDWSSGFATGTVSLSHQYAVHQSFATGTFATSSGQYSVLTNLFHSTKTNLTVRSTSNDKVFNEITNIGTYLTALRTGINSQYGLLGVVKLDVGHGGVLFVRHHIDSANDISGLISNSSSLPSPSKGRCALSNPAM
ncbi:hypothetical protein F4604DRAFT_1677066 [Suillus subluteus]|nr:hypothetical protein F4604DRAFT_1677066 [Suillus subluteus]